MSLIATFDFGTKKNYINLGKGKMKEDEKNKSTYNWEVVFYFQWLISSLFELNSTNTNSFAAKLLRLQRWMRHIPWPQGVHSSEGQIVVYATKIQYSYIL